MRGSTVAIFLFLSMLTCVETADAQTSIYLLTAGRAGCPNACERLSTIDPDRPAILSTATIPRSALGDDGIGSGEYVTPDGAFVVWLVPSASGSGKPPMIAMYNVSTRTTVTIPVPAATQAIVGHPRRAELFLTDAQGPLALSFAGARRLSGPACAGPGSRPVTISGDGSRVLYVCEGSPLSEAFIVDTDSGATVGTTMLGGRLAALSPDGRSLYRIEGPTSAAQLRRYAVDSGALLAEAPLSPQSSAIVHVDPRTGRVFVDGRIAEVFDGASLTPVKAGPMPWAGYSWGMPGGTWTFDPDRPRAYLTWYRIEEGGFGFTYEAISYYVLDTESLVPVLSIQDAPTQLNRANFVVAPRPAAPLELTATVQNSSVELTWSAGVSNATTLRHVIEAGSGPGLADLAILNVGPQTTVRVNGVPSGTYRVRVRAANVTGAGPASNEITVTVP
jgi:hypothetical protein